MHVFGGGSAAQSIRLAALPRALIISAVTFVTLACATLAFGASSAHAAGATASTAFDTFGVTSSDSTQSVTRFGERLADINVGSGVRDLLVSSYLASFNGLPGAGQVTLVNSRDRSIRYEIHSPEPQANAYFGFYIANLGDVNHDGNEDFAVGAPYENTDAAGNPCNAGDLGCNVASGKVFVFEGATGQFLYSISSPHPQQGDPSTGAVTGPGGFGARISTAGDVNGDGVPDIIVGAPGYDMPSGCSHPTPVPAGCHKTEGEAFIMNGANGALIRVLDLPASDEPPATCSASSSTCGRMGGTVSAVGDINGDGVPDQQVAAYSLKGTGGTGNTHGRIYIISGRDGSILSRIDAPEAGASQFLGLQDAAPYTPGDVNGDGVPDIYGGAFTASGAAGPSQGKACIWDGKSSVATGTGQLLYELKDPAAATSKSFGFSASKTFYDGDGTPDIVVGGIGEDHEIYIFDGGNGALLKTLAMPDSEYQHNVPGNSGSEFGWSERSLGDINGDCLPDYAGAAPPEDVNGYKDQGKVYFFVSNQPGGACPAPPVSTSTPPGVAPPPPGIAVVAMVATGYGLTNRTFAVGGPTPIFGSAAATKKSKKHKKGTTFRYTLSTAGTAKVVISQKQAGRRKGKKCVAAGKKSSKGKKCTLVAVRGTLTRTSHAGVNSVAFSGRIGSTALKPGRYSATLTVTGTVNATNPQTVNFTIVKG